MMSTSVAPGKSLAVESFLFANRLITHWRREPVMPTQSLLFPTFLLLTAHLLVDKSLMRINGTSGLYSLVPTCAIAGAVFGGLAAGMGIPFERDCGLLSKLWLLPVNRSSALIGRLIAEGARTFVASAFITAAGVGLGMRFKGGWLAVIPFILIPVLVAVLFSTLVIAIVVRAKRGTVLFWLGVPAMGAAFASSGVPPVETMSAWVRPFAQFQPLAVAIESMRALALGGPALWPLLLSLMWAVVIAMVGGPLAVRNYRAGAENGRLS